MSTLLFYFCIWYISGFIIFMIATELFDRRGIFTGKKIDFTLDDLIAGFGLAFFGPIMLLFTIGYMIMKLKEGHGHKILLKTKKN